MPLPRTVALFNKKATNRLTMSFAGRLRGFGIVVHRGRRSGATYRTPVNVFARPGGFVFALTYGRGDWVRNVMAAGRAELVTRGRRYEIANPRLVEDRRHVGFPPPVRLILRLIGSTECLIADTV